MAEVDLDEMAKDAAETNECLRQGLIWHDELLAARVEIDRLRAALSATEDPNGS